MTDESDQSSGRSAGAEQDAQGPSADHESASSGRAPGEGPAPSPEEEPTTTGTLFIMILFLMALGAMWGLMYLTLLER